MKNSGMERVTMVTQFYFNEREKDLLAFFPHTDERGGFKLSYSHVGQHSACHPEYVAESRLATPEEYEPLLRELVSIGYDVLIPQKSAAVDLLYDIVLENYMRLFQGDIAEELWSAELVRIQGIMSDTLDMVDIGFSRNPPDGDYGTALFHDKFTMTEEDAKASLSKIIIRFVNYLENINQKSL